MVVEIACVLKEGITVVKDIRCECPEYGEVSGGDYSLYRVEEYKGMNHEPNECLGDYKVKQYSREGKILWLCSCCDLSGDFLLENN